jgi:tRNA G46 methylase TrmB
MRYIVDFGCGVGQAVLTLANRFGNKTVYGIERNEARVNCLKARLAVHNIDNVDVVTCDWTKSVRDEAVWSFLSDVGFIFYNNFNCAGIVDESFM